MILDSIITKYSTNIGSGTTVTVLAADSRRRPFISFVRLVPSGIGTMDCQIGSKIVHDESDSAYTGFYVGDFNEAIQIIAGTEIETFRYIITCGYLGSPSGGAEKSVVQNS